MSVQWVTRSLFSAVTVAVSQFLAWVLEYFGVYSVISFGADPTGVTDSWAAFQAAADVVGPHRIIVPPGDYLLSAEVLTSQHRVHWMGLGQQVTRINFVPTVGDKAAFHFKLPTAAVLVQCSISGMTFKSSNTTLRKYAIHGTDVSIFNISDIAMTFGQFTGGAAIAPFTGGSSAAIKFNGREQITIRDCYLPADIPIWISTNPNNTISIDMLHCYDNQLNPGGTNYCYYIESGVNLSNCTLDGHKSIALGAGILYWVDTTSVQASFNLTMSNNRYEQGTTPAFGIRIEHNTALYDFVLLNSVWGGGGVTSGCKLRKVQNPRFHGYTYNGTGVALDMDSTCATARLEGVSFQDNSTMSMGTLVKIRETARTNGLSPAGRTELWIDAANSFFVAGRGEWFMGEQGWASQGTLADTLTTPIPSLSGAIEHGSVEIRFKGATKRGKFTVYYDDIGALMESTTDAAITAAGNVGGKLCVHWSTPALVQLRNNLGEAVSYSIRTIQSS